MIKIVMEMVFTLSTTTTQLGTYCIIDMEKWLFDIGILDVNVAGIVKETKMEVVSKNNNQYVEDYEDIELME